MSALAESTPQSPYQSEETVSPTHATAESTKSKKRSATEVSARKPEDDHRKRRRNRTTQSCVNCHTSKRMCDRKRPCGRCMSDNQDDKSRLQKRVAELEGVIRELKNKPHPRWVKPGDGPEKWHSQARLPDSSDKDSVDAGSQVHTPSTFSSIELWVDNQEPYLLGEDGNVLLQAPLGSSSSHMQATQQHIDSYQTQDANGSSPFACLSCFDTPSTFDAQSPVVTTPREEPFQPQVTIAVPKDQPPSDGQRASILQETYLPPAGMDGNLFDVLLNSMLQPDVCKEIRSCDAWSYSSQDTHRTAGHCGCMTDPMSYSVVLELTLHLRKAANSLGCSGRHDSSSKCLLYHLMTELDAYVATTLDNTFPPVTDSYSNAAFPQNRMGASNTSTSTTMHPHQSTHPVANRTLTSASPSSFVTVPSWDESFILWDSPR
ncbi:hypothetical protein NEOLEDRAFT_686425 [Neolentinus lepideus HHB14362 ss-1]|uniref:Zn(2)-C6 fungal-type domain-containing protein n=1 Tax=Neolentinus lepideus HHB14362 ss-1 TaxID=1314782 RepID=A0A165V095_9AGAM|nr:hypothetical protein NEOLEDRAFT_686425 [Neolentinus lepideus HHB14362 ss-1]